MEKPSANPRFEDLTGRHFGHLTVLSFAEFREKWHRAYWNCQCDCGALVTLKSGNLKRQESCSHCARQRRADYHGHRGWAEAGLPTSGEYNSWAGMIARCTNPKGEHFDRYGGRGIAVCDRWRHSFPNFLADLGPRPDGHWLERIDNDGNYEPGNCRWSTPAEQFGNRRTTRLLTHDGETHTITEWARILGIEQSALNQRLGALGWSLDDALTTTRSHRFKRGERLDQSE